MAWAIGGSTPGGEGKLPCGHAGEAEEANMLKKWREPARPEYFVTEAVDGEDELEMLTWDSGEDGEPTFGKQLSEVQRRALAELLRQHQGTLTKVPGCTHLAQHTIPTREGGPIRLPPYQLQHTYKEVVQ